MARTVHNVVLADVYGWDAPDYADAYIASAEWADGTPLTDEELDELDVGDYLC